MKRGGTGVSSRDTTHEINFRKEASSINRPQYTRLGRHGARDQFREAFSEKDAQKKDIQKNEGRKVIGIASEKGAERSEIYA